MRVAFRSAYVRPESPFAPRKCALSRSERRLSIITAASRFARKTPVGVEPTSAGLQPAASPSGPGVAVSPPGVEPGLRPSQGRVPPPHPRDQQYPDLDLNQDPDLRRVRCSSVTPSGHTIDSRGARSRTLCGCFGNSLLSQEHTPDHHVSGGNRTRPSTFTESHADRYTTDTVS